LVSVAQAARAGSTPWLLREEPLPRPPRAPMGTSGSAQLQAFVDGVIWLSLEELGPRRIRRTFELQTHRVELTGAIDHWPQEVA
jgi:hypothetical protein